MTNRAHTAVSLFTGAGGLDIGLERAGFEALGMVEMDRDCVATLEANRKRVAKSDLAIEGTNIAELDPTVFMRRLGVRKGTLALLSGGPPCQAFTTTGRRRALKDERGSVVSDYLRWLKAIQPHYFLMENVTGFMSAALRHRPLTDRGKESRPLAKEERKGSVFKWFLMELVAAGYTVTWGVLDAVDFGVPQFRQRAFLIGTLSPDPVFLPRATHVREDGKANSWRTLTDALKWLHEDAPLIQPLSAFKVKVFSSIPAGSNWRSLPERVRRETMGRAFHAEGGKSGWWRRLSWDRPAPTILTMPDHSSTGLIHPDETRCLSVRECARCQTFPDAWVFEGQSRSQYRQIGNAVPVGLAASLGKQIARHMAGKRDSVPDAPVWHHESANQRLGTWGWMSNEDKKMYVLNHRADHVDYEESGQLTLGCA